MNENFNFEQNYLSRKAMGMKKNAVDSTRLKKWMS